MAATAGSAHSGAVPELVALGRLLRRETEDAELPAVSAGTPAPEAGRRP